MLITTFSDQNNATYLQQTKRDKNETGKIAINNLVSENLIK